MNLHFIITLYIVDVKQKERKKIAVFLSNLPKVTNIAIINPSEFGKCADMNCELRRTSGGQVYTLTRKRVKNLNLRVKADGSTAVSAPFSVPSGQIDAFVDSRALWLEKAKRKILERQTQDLVPCSVTPEQALVLFEQISREIFPLFAQVLENQPPFLKVRDMKSRWGVCCPAKRRITLALRLAEKPREAVEYVILHEYAHFVRLDHNPAFWAVVERYMPDYRARRALLKG